MAGTYQSSVASRERASIGESETISALIDAPPASADALQVAPETTQFSAVLGETTINLPCDGVQPTHSPLTTHAVGCPPTRFAYGHAREQLLQRWREVRTTQGTTRMTNSVSKHLRVMFG